MHRPHTHYGALTFPGFSYLIQNQFAKELQIPLQNGFELNTASTIAALLYGEGDFSKTLMTAFNFGWDADNTAATAGTILGVIKGHRWMMSQGWIIVDRYKNTKRENMPDDETIRKNISYHISSKKDRIKSNNSLSSICIVLRRSMRYCSIKC